MILTNQPKTFVICFEDKDYTTTEGIYHQKITKKFYEELISSLNRYDWDWNVFPAIDGYALTQKDWNNIEVTIKKNTKFEKKLGAQGCFYSHFILWKKCIDLQQPILILEQDAIVLSEWRSVEIRNELLRIGYHFLHHERQDKITGSWHSGSWAYIIDPSTAATLINFCKKNYAMPVDKLFGTNIINYRFLEPPICKLNTPSMIVSTTNGKMQYDN